MTGDPHIHPDVERWIERFELNRHVVARGPLVLLLEHRPHRFGEHRPHVLAEELRPWPHQNHLSRAIDVGEAETPIEGEEAIGQGFEGGAEPVGQLLRRGLGCLPIRDVLIGPLHLVDLAGGVEQRLADRSDPDPPAGGGEDLNLDVERRAVLDAGGQRRGNGVAEFRREVLQRVPGVGDEVGRDLVDRADLGDQVNLRGCNSSAQAPTPSSRPAVRASDWLR